MSASIWSITFCRFTICASAEVLTLLLDVVLISTAFCGAACAAFAVFAAFAALAMESLACATWTCSVRTAFCVFAWMARASSEVSVALRAVMSSCSSFTSAGRPSPLALFAFTGTFGSTFSFSDFSRLRRAIKLAELVLSPSPTACSRANFVLMAAIWFWICAMKTWKPVGPAKWSICTCIMVRELLTSRMSRWFCPISDCITLISGCPVL
mmetsp:Transcript_40920/g.110647  ORF Transcript_40920/g.110647 Transcript_40920/m.110647 type:complete len:211 (+) Transcript_40920:366-998(+)